MEKNNSLDPAFVQLAQSNIELREELNREVDINRSNEKKIRRLIRDLEKCEGEIIRRSLTITDQENEINDLKIQISNLRKQLRSALKEIKSNESVIDSKNNQIVGYEEDILRLKARIKELTWHKKISSNQIEMANLNLTPPRIPGSPRMDNTPRTFGSVSQSIRNKIRRNPDSSLTNFVEYTLDELNRLYNQSQADLTTERDNTRIAIDDAMSWQNATAYILDDLDKNHKGEKLMHTFWRVYYAKNKTRLLTEIFALKILCNRYKNKAQPRAILYGKYNKWKNRTRVKHAKYNKWKLRTRLVRDTNLELEERINYLNQRILDLQNNIPQNHNNNRNMAGYELPKFHGLTDPEDFIRDFRRWCECANYDPGAGHNMRMRIHGIFENCLEGDAKDWYVSRIKNKNWELQNITANTGVVTLNAINALTNNQIRAIDVARFRGRARTIRETAPADGNLPARPLVSPHSVWDEDWIPPGRTAN